MADESIRFPDLRSFEVFGQIDFSELQNSFPHYLAEVDIYIPEDLQFIPISLKKEGETGCFYQYGLHENQHFCDIDIKEALRVGCRVVKVHQGIGFKESIGNFLSGFIQEMCRKREQVRDKNPVLGNTYKLFSNGVFGKTAVKDNEDSWIFTSVGTFRKFYANRDLIDYEYYPGTTPKNDRVLVRFSPNQDRADTFKSSKKSQKPVQTPYPSLVGVYILAHSRKVMNNFIHAIDGFRFPKVYYSDTDSLFIEEDSLNKLKELGYYGKNFGQGKNDLKKDIEVGCEEWKKITGKDCQCKCPSFHKYECDPVISKAYFLGPKQKWIETVCPATGRVFTSLTLKGIPNKINEKKINKETMEVEM